MLNLKDTHRTRTIFLRRRELLLAKPPQSLSKAPSGHTTPVHTAEHAQVSVQHFMQEYVIGKGGFGRVWRVRSKRSKRAYAMKEMLKLRVLSKRSVQSVLNERTLLGTLNHPFIVNMNYAFQDKDNLYLVMDLMPGGDLRYHIGKHKRFNELQTKFIVACLLTGLEYLHVNGIIHRDIKPENLVLDEAGYVHITDFGVARTLSTDNSKDTSGTPGYMAPEVLLSKCHGIAVDYFAVGVLAYEFLMGIRPYLGRNRNEIREHILCKQARIRKCEGLSTEAVDFVNSLLQRKAGKRLGANGPHEVKSHPWFKDFPWKDLLQKKLVAPYNLRQDVSYHAKMSYDWHDEVDCSAPLDSYQHLFADYYFEGSTGVKHVSAQGIRKRR